MSYHTVAISRTAIFRLGLRIFSRVRPPADPIAPAAGPPGAPDSGHFQPVRPLPIRPKTLEFGSVLRFATHARLPPSNEPEKRAINVRFWSHIFRRQPCVRFVSEEAEGLHQKSPLLITLECASFFSAPELLLKHSTAQTKRSPARNFLSFAVFVTELAGKAVGDAMGRR